MGNRGWITAGAAFVFLAFVLVPFGAIGVSVAASSDLMDLTDEPGNWFRSQATGTPVSVVDIGGRVDFRIGALTNTRHTVTLLVKPTGSTLQVDQPASVRGGGISATFDRAGVYLFVCKIHPYMTGVVGVRDANGAIPPVTKEMLPFIGHLGLASLPAANVLAVLTTIAPTENDKLAKWDIFGPADQIKPATPGVGEVWVNTQFEAVPGQTDAAGVPKPGTLTVLDVATFNVEREVNGLDPDANDGWNNPHNLWTNVRHSVMYNTNWFGEWINKIDRATGNVLETIKVGDAPTHIVTNPNEHSAHAGILTTPLSARKDLVKIRNEGELEIIDSDPTGQGNTHPHGQWVTADGRKIVVPNVFKGLGLAGSISIMDMETSAVLREFTRQPSGLAAPILMPVASGIKGSTKAYIANIASGQVTVIDLVQMRLRKNIPVTFTPNGLQGSQFTLFDTLQAPIQIPVSPNGRFVGVAVLSLTTVGRPPTGAAGHVAIIDTVTDTVVKVLGTPAGTHGAHWGAKLGGGYYLYVTNQHANALTVIDPDPNKDNSAADATVVGRIRLANGSTGAGVTDGTGGQGLKPLPNVYDGWVQDTVALSGTGQLAAEVQGWINALTPCQKAPGGPGC